MCFIYLRPTDVQIASDQVDHHYFLFLCLVCFSSPGARNADSTICFNYHRNYHLTSYLVCVVSLAYFIHGFGCRHAGDGISEDDGRADHM
jgi:hypothetical protein